MISPAKGREWLILGFAAGAGAAPWIHASPAWGLALAALVPATLRWGRRLPWTLLLLAALAGLSWGNLRLLDDRKDALAAAVARSPQPAFLWVRGTVEAAEPWPDGSRCVLRTQAFLADGKWEKAGSRIQTYLPVPPPLDGSDMEASLALALPRPPHNPGQFDMARYLARKDVDLTGSCRSPELLSLTPAARWHVLARYRRALEQRLMADGGREGGTLLAILLGERGLMDPASVDALGASGLYHLVALSGFNVALLLVILTGLAHATGLRPSRRDLLSLVLLALYGLLVAAQPSLSRALLMALLFLTARLLARPQGGLAAWTIALALLLAVEPRWASDAGFQLTFAATLGILLLWDAYPSALPSKGPMGTVLRLLWAGLSAQLATLPFVALTFHRISLLGWLATPLASLPLMALQAVGTAYLLGLAFVPGVHTALGWAMGGLTRAFLFLPGRLGDDRIGSLFLPDPWWGWVLLYGLCFLAILRPGRWRRAGWTALLFTLVCAWVLPAPGPSRLSTGVAVLDVGEASCQVIRWRGATLLVDAGNGAGKGRSSGRSVVEPFLAAAGVRALDGIVLTHWDADHAGSAAELLKDLPVGWLAFPATDGPTRGYPGEVAKIAGRRGAALLPLARGQEVVWRGLVLRVLNPAFPPSQADANDRSLVIRAEFPGAPALFTGDLQRAAEAELLSAGLVHPAYAQLVPHHGSATSSSPGWVAAVRPGVALVSVGVNSRFGHPSPEVMERYLRSGSRTYRTDLDGALLLNLEAARPRVLRMRDGDWLGAPP